MLLLKNLIKNNTNHPMIRMSAIALILLLMIPLPALASNPNRGIALTIKTKTGTEVGLYKESHALVIGVSQYTGAWPKLPGVKKDVAVVSQALRKNGFHVVVVEDPNKNPRPKGTGYSERF